MLDFNILKTLFWMQIFGCMLYMKFRFFVWFSQIFQYVLYMLATYTRTIMVYDEETCIVMWGILLLTHIQFTGVTIYGRTSQVCSFFTMLFVFGYLVMVTYWWWKYIRHSFLFFQRGYLCSNITAGNNAVRPGDALNIVKYEIELKRPGRIVATKLRKHTATISQVRNYYFNWREHTGFSSILSKTEKGYVIMYFVNLSFSKEIMRMFLFDFHDNWLLIYIFFYKIASSIPISWSLDQTLENWVCCA